MKLFGIAIAALLVLSVVALGSVTTVAACGGSNWNHWNSWSWNHQNQQHKERYQPSLVFFYCSNGSSNTHLIADNHTQDTQMLKVVKQLDYKYNVTYYDLSTHPGSINMARFAYGVTSTPTISVIGPDFPAVASNFYNIQGVHSYADVASTIEHTAF